MGDYRRAPSDWDVEKRERLVELLDLRDMLVSETDAEAGRVIPVGDDVCRIELDFHFPDESENEDHT